MSSLECVLRYTVVDTPWFMTTYLIIFIILFAHKQYSYATIFGGILLFLTYFAITGCMSSIGAFTSITIPNWIVIMVSFVILFGLSLVKFDNIYVKYVVSIVVIYVLFGYGLFYKIMDMLYPSQVKVISIGGVDVRGKTKDELNKLFDKVVVKV